MLLVTRHRGRAERIRALLEIERFDVAHVADGVAALAIAQEREPTVILVDWSICDDPNDRDELLFRLRPRRIGPRVVAIADHRQSDAAGETRGVRGVVDPHIDAEQLVDAVWRVHNEVLDARERHLSG